jgi:hypothetical protein
MHLDIPTFLEGEADSMFLDLSEPSDNHINHADSSADSNISVTV